MTQTQPVNVDRRAIDGQQNVHLGPQQVIPYNQLLGEHTRVKMRAAHYKPQTELFGTAPYVAVGRGHLHNIDASNAVRFGALPTNSNVPKRVLHERQLERWDYLDHKPRVEPGQRAGILTRIGPQYVRPGL
jgi:hypothetical protein